MDSSARGTGGAPAGTGVPDERGLTGEELALATRNAGMPLEALRYAVTPVGLHYLLIHYDIPVLDAATFTLEVTGCVERPRSFGLADLQALGSVTARVTLECAGNGRARLSPRPLSQPWLHEAVGTAEWTGVPLAAVLGEVGPTAAGREVVFTGADEGVEAGRRAAYARGLELAEARRDDLLLAWAMNGQPLPVQHGFPLRLVVPGWYGMASVKWLTGISVQSEPFTGYQNSHAYRWRTDADDPGTPLTRMAVRALLAPPGVPDFFTRRRFVPEGPCLLEGRAWSGAGPVVRVECSADGGVTWWEAQVESPTHPAAWQRWETTWQATPGVHEVCVRATDATGSTQPLAPVWNAGGYAVNAVHRVAVEVEPPVPVTAPARGSGAVRDPGDA